MTTSTNAPYTQAARRNVPSIVNPAFFGAAIIGALSAKVSTCSPRTANPHS
ncbi:hypothetical protein ABZ479_32540 [Streptomyces sp. NPDC005722]